MYLLRYANYFRGYSATSRRVSRKSPKTEGARVSILIWRNLIIKNKFNVPVRPLPTTDACTHVHTFWYVAGMVLLALKFWILFLLRNVRSLSHFWNLITYNATRLVDVEKRHRLDIKREIRIIVATDHQFLASVRHFSDNT